ncbi:hypothetical protein AX15_000761 [Amanita polypyramis BW_CC]|nr:hypothetical protein AX15_000761 [Amanita polypyramis BW_CC]
MLVIYKSRLSIFLWNQSWSLPPIYPTFLKHPIMRFLFTYLLIVLPIVLAAPAQKYEPRDVLSLEPRFPGPGGKLSKFVDKVHNALHVAHNFGNKVMTHENSERLRTALDEFKHNHQVAVTFTVGRNDGASTGRNGVPRKSNRGNVSGQDRASRGSGRGNRGGASHGLGGGNTLGRAKPTCRM